jgi:hypothetical protein
MGNSLLLFLAIMLCIFCILYSYQYSNDNEIMRGGANINYQSYFIPYAKGNFNDGLYVRISINGGAPKLFRLDTGSVGLIVNEQELGVTANMADSVPGQITYTSSGITLSGNWVPTQLTFTDSYGVNPVSLYTRSSRAGAILPILAVNHRSISPGAVNARSSRNKNGLPRVFMLGVGFGRGPHTDQSKNPFLNISNIMGNRGYIITRNGIYVGKPNSPKGLQGFNMQKLQRRLGNSVDWNPAQGWIVLKYPNGKIQRYDTNILMDTGLTNVIISTPGQSRVEIPEGTQIHVNLPAKQSYSFITSTFNSSSHKEDSNGLGAPNRVTLTGSLNGMTNLNTGLHAFQLFDYLFDADRGILGLRRVQ